MERITVPATKSYDVIIEDGIIEQAGEIISKVCVGKNAAIISDTTTKKLFSDIVRRSLEDKGFKTLELTVPAGEASKSAENFIWLINRLAKEKFNRADCIIALGGGVVGDLAGFVASTYLRGVTFIQIPTTLLAAVDSSVGGKTAINLEAGKNLAGAFYQPSCVICDTKIIKALPEDIFSDGMAEVIKYGAIRNDEIFRLIEDGVFKNLPEIIGACVRIKSDIVAADEFDRGERQLLNFGHTPAHAIEKLSNFKISHGRAVAAGMCIMARAAEKLGYCESGVADELSKLCGRFSLPTVCEFSAEQLFSVALSDKKRFAGSITLVLPKKRGESILVRLPENEIKSFFEAGLERE